MKVVITIEVDGNDVKISTETEKETMESTESTIEKEESDVKPDVSDYARFFDESCTGWEKDAEYNLVFLNMQQNYANEKLHRQGYLFLNDVYQMLGIPKTKVGQIVGWIYDEEHPIGDNYVDFGIYDLRNAEFVNGHKTTALLDFNVDGNILEYIDLI